MTGTDGGTYEWLEGAGMASSFTYRLARPLIGIVMLACPKDQEHLAYAARCTALRMLGDEGEADRIGLAAHLCNVGMIGMLARLAAKTGPLTAGERLRIQAHPELGAVLLDHWADLDPAMADIARAVRHHHERWDGAGYPDGLEGKDIPFPSRVIAAAETLHAMLSPRPYRDALPDDVAHDRLASAAGSQLDPEAVAALLARRAERSERS